MKLITSWMTAICMLSGCPARVRAQAGYGTNEQAAKRGATVTVTYGGTVFSEFAGGIRRAETYSGNLNVELSLDGDRLFGRSGLPLFIDGLWIHRGQPSALLGDAQGVSNLSAPSKIALYEAWCQYNVIDNRVSVLAGRYDLNSEFYLLQTAGLFLNSSFGLGPGFQAAVSQDHRSFPTHRLVSASSSSPRGVSFSAVRFSMGCLLSVPTVQREPSNETMDS